MAAFREPQPSAEAFLADPFTPAGGHASNGDIRAWTGDLEPTGMGSLAERRLSQILSQDRTVS